MGENLELLLVIYREFEWSSVTNAWFSLRLQIRYFHRIGEYLFEHEITNLAVGEY